MAMWRNLPISHSLKWTATTSNLIRTTRTRRRRIMPTGNRVWQGGAPRKSTLATVLALAVPTALSGLPRAAAQEWKPEKPVEIIATNAPGGGSDRIGRIMIKILQERRLVPTPVNLVNRPG